jgi:hypothetical protein
MQGFMILDDIEHPATTAKEPSRGSRLVMRSARDMRFPAGARSRRAPRLASIRGTAKSTTGK